DARSRRRRRRPVPAPHLLGDAPHDADLGRAREPTAAALRDRGPHGRGDPDVRFSVAGVSHPATGFAGTVELHQYGPAEYHWSADGAHGRPDRSLPPTVSRLPAGRPFTAPASSLSVLVGSGPPG